MSPAHGCSSVVLLALHDFSDLSPQHVLCSSILWAGQVAMLVAFSLFAEGRAYIFFGQLWEGAGVCFFFFLHVYCRLADNSSLP